MLKYQELSFMSGIISIIAFSFFIYRVHITKNTDNITFLWIFLIIIAQTLMVIYGKINHIHGLYIPALIFITGILYILYIKIIYKETNKIEDELRQKSIIKVQ